MSPEFQLTPGSRYRIVSAKTREDVFTTEGTFEGITSMGSIDAMVLDIDGNTELVPTHVILKIEILEAAGEDDLDEDESSMHYT